MPQTISHAGYERLLDQLDAAGIEYTVLPHRRTLTATDEAAALGVPPSAVAKTIVLVTPNGFVRAVLPASEHLDLRKVREALGVAPVELATEAELAGAYPGYELGAVPPLGGAEGAVLVDIGVARSETILVEAGVHDASLRLRTADLVAHERAVVADLCA